MTPLDIERVVGLSEGMYLALGPKGIQVSCLCPAGVLTNIVEQITVHGTIAPPRAPTLKLSEAEEVGELVATGVEDGRFLILTAPEAADELAAHGADVAIVVQSTVARAVSGGASTIGLGVSQTAVTQQFSQGSFKSTDGPLDMAINGGGFFQLKDLSVLRWTDTADTMVVTFGEVADGARPELAAHRREHEREGRRRPRERGDDPSRGREIRQRGARQEQRERREPPLLREANTIRQIRERDRARRVDGRHRPDRGGAALPARC